MLTDLIIRTVLLMLKRNRTLILAKELFMLQNFSNSMVSKLFIVSKLYFFDSFQRAFFCIFFSGTDFGFWYCN